MKKWKTKNGNEIFQILSGRSNVFLCKGNNLNILIDTSTKRNWNRLCKTLYSMEVNHIDYLILTHSHYDHAENAMKIKEKFYAKVIVHKEEVEYIESGKNPIIDGTNFITKTIVRIGRNLFIKMKYPRCIPDIIVNDFYYLNSSDKNLKIIYTPGHSIGSVSFVINDEIACVGDTMFGIFKNSVLPPYAIDKVELFNSLDNLLKTNCSVFLPGHGSAISRKKLIDFLKRAIHY